MNKNLLKAIDAYRNGWAEPGSIEWDELMHYFQDSCIEYTMEKLYEKGFNEEDAADFVNSADSYPYFCDFLDMYLLN